MGNIRISQKPEWLRWDDLAACQQRAHESNKARGVNMQCADLSGITLKNTLRDAITLVALDESDTIAGMLSIEFRQVKRWWYNGCAAYICYVAVTPEFKGRGIYKSLSNSADEIVRNNGVDVEYLNTHIDNTIAIRVYENDGYSKVRFSPGSGTDYYSVEMAKWINERRRKNKFICRLCYICTEFISRIIYKPGKIRRF